MWWVQCTFLNFSFEATNKVDDEALIKASDDQWALFVRVTRSESRLFFIRNNCLPLPQGCWCLISTRSLQSRKEGLILSTFLVGIKIGDPVVGHYQHWPPPLGNWILVFEPFNLFYIQDKKWSWLQIHTFLFHTFLILEKFLFYLILGLKYG